MFASFEKSCTLLYLVLFLGSRAEVVVENKAYQNVVVSFSPRIPPENASQLVNSMKQILQDTSTVLETAIGFRIGSVIFHLPQTWDISKWNDASSGHRASSRFCSSNEIVPDINVDSLTDSAFGIHPLAIQYSGCGVPGLEISVPQDFLTGEENYPKSKLLAREWLKYRYGVFDENGFDSDGMYPSYFIIPGSDDVHVTDCTFPEVDYHFKDSAGNNCSLTTKTASDCSIYPREESKENLTSSLLFYHKELPSVNHVCGHENYSHNVDSPSKHNLLCAYKSISDVLKLSKDFNSDQVLGEESNEIQYSYIQDSLPRIAIAWQNTQSLRKQGSLILHAVRKFLYDLPLHSKIALYSFQDELNQIRSLSELTTDEERSVNLISNFINPVEACASCAVNTMVDALLEDNKDETGTVVIMLASNPTEDDQLVEKLKNSKLCLVIIAFSGTSKDAWNKFIEVSPCSKVLEIPNSENKVVFNSLYNELELLLPLSINDTRTSIVATELISSEEPITISADPTAKIFTLWIFADNHLESNSVSCKVKDEDIELTLGIQSQNIFQLYFTPQTDEVKCAFRFPFPPHLTQVQVTSEKGAYFVNHAWIHDTTPEESKEQMPVIIFARLNYGQYPIRGAEVKAKVIAPNGHQVNITLFDNGRGDPDITQNDGIYSAYFSQFELDGDYEVAISANDNGKQAKFGKNGQKLCCGSTVVSESIEVHPFEWTFNTGFHAISKKPEEGYKPSRIVDLRVESIDLPKSVTLTWTSPGGELHQGQVSSYEFYMFCQHEDCNDDGVFPHWVGFSNKIKPKPKELGRDEKVGLLFSEHAPKNTTIYFVIKAINSKFQKSDASNRVLIKIMPSNLQGTITPVIPEDNNEIAEGPEAGLIVAYILIAITILILIAGAIYFTLIRAKSHRTVEINVPEAPENNGRNNSFPSKSLNRPKEHSIRRVESFPVLLYTHDQIRDFKEKIEDPPLYKPPLAPKPWVSLNVLSSGDNMDNNRSNSASASTVHTEGNKLNEIKQLDDISQVYDPYPEKHSKF